MPVPQPEEVMELASELKEARSRVAELESRWKSFFNQPSVQKPETDGPSVIQFLRPRIIEFLETRPDRAFAMAHIASSLNAKENSVGPYLSDLVKEGKIARRGRGLYGSLHPKGGDDDSLELAP